MLFMSIYVVHIHEHIYCSFVYDSSQFLMVEQLRHMMTYSTSIHFYAYQFLYLVIIKNQLGNHPANLFLTFLMMTSEFVAMATKVQHAFGFTIPSASKNFISMQMHVFCRASISDNPALIGYDRQDEEVKKEKICIWADELHI